MRSTLPNPSRDLPASGRGPIAVAATRSSSSDDDDPGDADQGRDTATIVREQVEEPKLKPPPMFKVILLNDDYTPQEFVVHVLMRFFYMDVEKAWRLMWTVHTTGSAVIGIYPRDIAETKSEQVNAYAQENNHPLKSAVEETDAD